MSIEKLPLHDAVIEQISIDWRSSRVELELLVFTDLSKPASSHKLVFQDLKEFQCSRTDEWGPSSSILEVTYSDARYLIKVQSGDEISISAGAYEFKQIGL